MKPRDRWYVSIEHLTDDELEFFGWYKVRDGDEFAIYAKPYGAEQQVVDKHGKRFLLVDDRNDAIQMRGAVMLEAPSDPTKH